MYLMLNVKSGCYREVAVVERGMFMEVSLYSQILFTESLFISVIYISAGA